MVGLKVGQGEQVAALVVPAYARGESRRAVEDRLRTDFDKVARELSAHKRIRILRFTDAEMPRTRTRKIKRADVAAMLRRMLEVRTSVADAANSEVETWLARSARAGRHRASQHFARDAADRGPRPRLAGARGSRRA